MDIENNFIGDFLNDLAYITDNESSSESSNEEEDEAYAKQVRTYRRSKLIPFYNTRKDIFTYFEEEKLIKTFRFDRASIEIILSLIVHLLPKRKTKAKRNLEPIDMLLVTLQFYATGTFQSVVGNVLRYSQSSVCRSISIISLALAMISKKKIAFPADLLTLKRDFYEIARMAGVVGFIDGTHIRIVRPQNHEKNYVNRKNYHSLNVQAICDANHRFLSVCATKPGSCHDSTIFKGSIIGKKFESGQFGEPFLLGDSGYSNTTFLLTPYSNPIQPYEVRFNRSHKSTRCTIERAFGVLKKRFNLLHGEIRMSPTKASWITVACCVLHNIAIDRKMPLDDPELDEIDDEVAHCHPAQSVSDV
ncbi:putative nuclease HARBI1 [Daphnia pulicaria]|uniref:putative nuclease HARBI1 n=1 Tax=Daphnia pulicaria TaxID=35523 RepID=UPI001EEC352B|nr:putative nuclease HARBI1 [Daphnia pulicaria]